MTTYRDNWIMGKRNCVNLLNMSTVFERFCEDINRYFCLTWHFPLNERISKLCYYRSVSISCVLSNQFPFTYWLNLFCWKEEVATNFSTGRCEAFLIIFNWKAIAFLLDLVWNVCLGPILFNCWIDRHMLLIQAWGKVSWSHTTSKTYSSNVSLSVKFPDWNCFSVNRNL